MNKDLYNGSIFIYSNHCRHSVNLYNMLKSADALNSFRLVCIDADPKTKRRPMQFYEIQKMLNVNIASVPTLIVENAKYVLSGTEAFKYVSNLVNPNKQEKAPQRNQVAEGPLAFNPNEMGASSDSYFNFGNIENYANAEVPRQSYHFLDDQFNIETPDESSFSGVKEDGYYQKMSERENFEKVVYNDNKNKPKANFQSGKGGNKASQKQIELEDRYNRLLQERERIGAKPVSRPKVDFSTGQIQY